MSKIILIFLSIFCSFGIIKSSDFCGDWIHYKDKCYKVIEEKTTQEKALKECLKLDSNSTLITISVREEQQFLNQYLVKYNNISMNAWIGMKYNTSDYKWMDSTESDFNNWSDEADLTGVDPCVHMSLSSCKMLGKWMDSSCKRNGLIVCQKKPYLNLKSLQNIMEILPFVFNKQAQTIETLSVRNKICSNELEKLNTILVKQNSELKSIELENDSMIPFGFIYTQFPNEKSPQNLWPNMMWRDVSNQYYQYIKEDYQKSEQHPNWFNAPRMRIVIWERVESLE